MSDPGFLLSLLQGTSWLGMVGTGIAQIARVKTICLSGLTHQEDGPRLHF